MALEQPRPGEALAAVLTLAALVVGPHVHRVGRHANVELVAVRAPSGLLVSRTPVGLPVASQVAGSAVSLAAVVTLVVVAFRQAGQFLGGTVR